MSVDNWSKSMLKKMWDLDEEQIPSAEHPPAHDLDFLFEYEAFISPAMK